MAQLPKFPSEDFFDFNRGVPVEYETINEWIKECYQDIQNGAESSGRASGNTRVEMIKHAFKNVAYYDVYVNQGYYNATFHD